MTGGEYRCLRIRIGTQQEAACALGVDRVTISRRERGDTISREAELAMIALSTNADPPTIERGDDKTWETRENCAR